LTNYLQSTKLEKKFRNSFEFSPFCNFINPCIKYNTKRNNNIIIIIPLFSMMRKARKESSRKYASTLSFGNQTNLIKVIAAAQQKDKPL
jgi:hypothetical protein